MTGSYSDDPLRLDAESATQTEQPRGPRRERLPLEARVEPHFDRCIIRLPVRRQEVTVRKETFVFETATIRRQPIREVQRIEDKVRAEQLRAEVQGDIAVVREDDTARPPQDRELPRE